jgi:hypothetical protein
MWQPRGDGNGDNPNAQHHLACPDGCGRGGDAGDRYTKAQHPDPARDATTVRPRRDGCYNDEDDVRQVEPAEG